MRKSYEVGISPKIN
ncbi:hypothetical protein, partial [Escherichia coli]